MISLPFGLNLLEQFGFGSFQIVSEFHCCFQSFGIDFEPSFAISWWQDRKRRKCPDRDSARSARRLISGSAAMSLKPPANDRFVLRKAMSVFTSSN